MVFDMFGLAWVIPKSVLVLVKFWAGGGLVGIEMQIFGVLYLYVLCDFFGESVIITHLKTLSVTLGSKVVTSSSSF